MRWSWTPEKAIVGRLRMVGLVPQDARGLWRQVLSV
jgi:hypothetical protein